MVDRFKETLRRTYQYVRKQLPPDYISQASAKIIQRIQGLYEYRYAKNIALYHPTHGEVDLRSLWKSAPLHGKYCYFPVLNNETTLSFYPATPLSIFHKNRYGIEEPLVSSEQALPLEQLDLILMPLVAVDKRGVRLGMGKGYYDRTLAKHQHPLLVGVAYEFQRVAFIEAQKWDISVNVVITDKEIYWSPSI